MIESKKICFLAQRYKPSIGGAEISLEKITDGLKKDVRFVPTILTALNDEKGNLLKGQDKYYKHIQKLGFSENITFEDPNRVDIATNRVLKRFIEIQDKYDIVYFNTPYFLDSEEKVKIASKINIPIIMKFPDSVVSRLQKTKPLIDNLLKHKLTLHCISMEIFELSLELGFDKSQLFYCPNPIDEHRFRLKCSKDRSIIAHRYGINEQDIVLVFTGRFCEQKNIPGLLRLFGSLRYKDPRYKLLMLGYAVDSKMKKYINSIKQMNNGVIWGGKIPNSKIGEYLRGADFFVLSSLYEGMSNSLLEAMSSGLVPIVPSSVSGMQDLVLDGQNGLMYNHDDINKVIAKMLLLGKEDIARMGKSARESVIRKCGLDNVIGQHKNLYHKLFNSYSG